MDRVRTRIARLIISASLIATVTPAAQAGAYYRASGTQVGASCVGTDGPVSVVAQTTYRDASGALWIDGVVSNDSTRTLAYTEVPVSFVSSGVPVPDETVDVCIDTRLLEGGKTATFHHRFWETIPETWTPVAAAGGGWNSDTPRLGLEVVSVEPVVPMVPAGMSAQCESDLAARTYRVVVRNPHAVPVTGARVFGPEYQGVPGGEQALLDTVSNELWCEPISPDATASVEVYGLVGEDVDPDTVVTQAFEAEAVELPSISLKFDTVAPKFGEPVNFTMALKNSAGALITGGRTLKLAWSLDGENWSYTHYETDTGVVSRPIVPKCRVYYKAVYWGGDDYGHAESGVVMVQPQSEVTVPGIALSSTTRNHAFGAAGFVKPDHSAGSHDVKLQCYRYENGAWVLRKTVSSTAVAYPGSYAKYTASLSLPLAGRWRVRAYHPADAQARGDVSGYDYLTVR